MFLAERLERREMLNASPLGDYFDGNIEEFTASSHPVDAQVTSLADLAPVSNALQGSYGTTGTGLDRLVEIIRTDPGLQKRVPADEILEAAGYADTMNQIIVWAIGETGVANDAALNSADIRDVNAKIRDSADWIEQQYGTTWTELHGDDTDTGEYGFHLVQNDGATSRWFGNRNAVNTVADGIYHIGFAIDHSNFLNEDGNRNASVEDVAWWLDDLLADDLEDGSLSNDHVVYPQPTTGTGLDQLVEIILFDRGLNQKVATSEIHEAARAANAMNELIVAAVAATGVANDGTLDKYDLVDVNAWLREHHGGTSDSIDWAQLHGDDSESDEYGFHLVQNDGATTRLYARNAVDTVADGIYHIGFPIVQDHFLNEDGNRNASVETVAWWLEDLLDVAFEEGALLNPDLQPDLAAIAAEAVYSAETVTVEPPGIGSLEVPHNPLMALAEGTVSMRFTADDVAGRKTLFSKDARDYGDGGHLTAFVRDGRVEVRLQTKDRSITLGTPAYSVTAGQEHHLAVTFGPDGFRIYLDGQQAAARLDVTSGIEANTETLAIGANIWSRDARRPTWTADYFDGTITDFAIHSRSLSRLEIAAIGSPDGPAEPSRGTTGTGLDQLVDMILADPGLRARVPQAEIETAARAADEMNGIIVEAIRMTNLAWDGTLNEADLRDLNGYIQENYRDPWVLLHGDDEGTEETGFHLVQNDGAKSRMFGGYNAVDTVADGIYHMGFAICGNHFLNEDGNANASVETVAWWLSELLEADLENRSLADSEINPYAEGSSETGLDELVSMIAADEGLNRNIASSEITEGAQAADAMNKIIVEAIHSTGVANDGTINTADVRELNLWIRSNGEYIEATYGASWADLHGDDEDCREWGFHLVQNDGATTRSYGDNAVNTVADGIYHLGFEICGDQFLNEDGNANASVAVVAYWLSDLLEEELASGDLNNPAVDAYAQPTTSTGLDRLVEIIVADPGLNHKLPTSEITEGARAADRLNQLLIEAILETGVANDGAIAAADMVAVNSYLRAHHLAEWTDLHGDDENCREWGFHLVQNDGATTRLYGSNAVDTVADGIYHAGFEIQCNRFLNEDGNKNASVATVARWLNDLLAEDLASGRLVNGVLRVDLDALAVSVANAAERVA